MKMEPPKLCMDDVKSKKDFQLWMRKWSLFTEGSGLHLQSKRMQAVILQCCLDDRTTQSLIAHGMSEEDENDPKKILDILSNIFHGAINYQIERSKFNKTVQRNDETIKEYLNRLRNLARYCEFCNEECTNKAIAAQMVQGLRDKTITQEILKLRDEPFRKIIDMAYNIEDSKRNIQEMTEESQEISAIRKKIQRDADKPGNDIKNCRNCGFDHPIRRCPAFGEQCRKCQKFGHFEKHCRSTPTYRKNIKVIEDNANDDDSDEEGLMSLSKQLNRIHVHKDDPPAPKILITCKAKKTAEIEMLPDTGADLCAADSKFQALLGIKKLQDTNIKTKAVNGYHVPIKGKLLAEFCLNGRRTIEEVFIMKSINRPILSWIACQRLGIIPKQYPQPINNHKTLYNVQAKEIRNMKLEEYANAYQDNLPQNSKEPIIMKKGPEHAFQEIAMDFAQTRRYNFLITVDCKTDWPDIFIINKKTDSMTLINKCREIFRRTAIPNILWSDKGPQFRSQKFQEFLKDWGILHLTRSPWHHQSNGKAETTIKSMKKIIQNSMRDSQIDEDRLLTALLQYRNTPNKRDNVSPALKLFGHPIQNRLPMHKKSLNQGTTKKTERKAHTFPNGHDYQVKKHYSRSAKELHGLKPDEQIAMYNQSTNKWATHGIIVQRISKRLELEPGSILHRNRKYLRPRNLLSVTRNEPREILRKTIDLRRSTRTKKAPNRLIEEN